MGEIADYYWQQQAFGHLNFRAPRRNYMARPSKGDTYEISGEIEAVSRNGKGFKVEGEWYNVYKASELQAETGDTVTFTVEEVDKGGTTFRNVKGTVEADGGGGKRPAPARGGRGGGAPQRSAGATTKPEPRGPGGMEAPYLGSGNYVTKLWPIPEDHPDRAIARAVALKAAIDSLKPEEKTFDLEVTLDLAKEFEAYLTGSEE